MQSALLRGREHTSLGAVGAIAQGRCAVALSRGGAHKLYAHQEPNEDAVLFARGEGGALIAVADGHHGASGSEQVVEWLRDRRASAWLGAPGPPADEETWRREVLGCLGEMDRDIAAGARKAGLMAAPTTLSLAVARPAEGRCWHASIGDSHVFQVVAHPGGASLVTDVSSGRLRPDAVAYLGGGFESADALSDSTETGIGPLAGLRALVLATDGLSERGIGVIDPSEEVARLADAEHDAELGPLTLARGLVEVALDAQRHHGSGDNVGVAVIWLD